MINKIDNPENLSQKERNDLEIFIDDCKRELREHFFSTADSSTKSGDIPGSIISVATFNASPIYGGIIKSDKELIVTSSNDSNTALTDIEEDDDLSLEEIKKLISDAKKMGYVCMV